MKDTADELLAIVEAFTEKIGAISDDVFSAKPLAHKWSKKEVLGHLIDSAQNNLRRFICAQYEHVPPAITYQQDFWVNVNGYQRMKKNDVITLWKLVNERIGEVLSNMPAAHRAYMVNTGKDQPNLHPLHWLAPDYVKHMKHHLNQIIPGSFDVIYP